MVEQIDRVQETRVQRSLFRRSIVASLSLNRKAYYSQLLTSYKRGVIPAAWRTGFSLLPPVHDEVLADRFVLDVLNRGLAVPDKSIARLLVSCVTARNDHAAEDC